VEVGILVDNLEEDLVDNLGEDLVDNLEVGLVDTLAADLADSLEEDLVDNLEVDLVGILVEVEADIPLVRAWLAHWVTHWTRTWCRRGPFQSRIRYSCLGCGYPSSWYPPSCSTAQLRMVQDQHHIWRLWERRPEMGKVRFVWAESQRVGPEMDELVHG
jgi:hypothetical protein